MCFHWVASFGFDGADVRKENRFKKKIQKQKKVERRRWDEGGVLYRFANAWVVWEEGWKELKKKKKMRWHLWHLGGVEKKFLGRYFLYNAITCFFIHKTAITSFYKNISFK